MSAPENPPAFPTYHHPESQDGQGQSGMSLRDYFAARAPEPSSDMLATQCGIDRARNPHNEPHKPPLRSEYEIRAYLAYLYADAMLAEREKQP